MRSKKPTSPTTALIPTPDSLIGTLAARAPPPPRRPQLEPAADRGVLAFGSTGGLALHDLRAGTTSVVGCRGLEGSTASAPAPVFAGPAMFSPAGNEVLCAPMNFSE